MKTILDVYDEQFVCTPPINKRLKGGLLGQVDECLTTNPNLSLRELIDVVNKRIDGKGLELTIDNTKTSYNLIKKYMRKLRQRDLAAEGVVCHNKSNSKDDSFWYRKYWRVQMFVVRIKEVINLLMTRQGEFY